MTSGTGAVFRHWVPEISFSFFSSLSYGSIYPALRKLKQEGFINMKVEVQDGSPNRKLYTIMDSGRKVFLENLRIPFTVATEALGLLDKGFIAPLKKERNPAFCSFDQTDF